MKIHFSLSLLAIASCLALPVLAGFDHSHAALDGVLRKHVNGSGVDYAGLKKDPKPLDGYLDSVAAVSEASFKEWSKEQQMAMLINLYNAATLKLVVDHYPEKSIKKIGSWSGGPWKQRVVRLFGEKRSLDYIEHDLLRPNYHDPRIHFAVNCASIGCPPLRSEAFTAAKLGKQMDEQARIFLGDGRNNRIDAKARILYLSSIFDWFKDDFVKKSGSVEKFIAPYFNEADRKLIQGGELKIRYSDYDWNLNEQ